MRQIGVSKLNKIQKDYSDIETSPWFNGKQLGVAKARKDTAKIEPHMDRIAEYVGEMEWDPSERSMNDASALSEQESWV